MTADPISIPVPAAATRTRTGVRGAALWRIVGPGIVAAGVGLSSGEFILWPLIASQVGLVFLWGALLGVGTQFFLNMEIERYTLATGETAVAGFVRFWKPWGILFCLFTIVPNMWPGWGTSGVTILTFLLGGGNVPLITIGVLVASGIALTASPVVYQTLEKAQFFKVGLTLVFLAIAIVAAINQLRMGMRVCGDAGAASDAISSWTSPRSNQASTK